MKHVHLILSLFFAFQSNAQLPEYHVQLFDESFGVRTSDVRKAVMDQRGLVWILHHDRVQRFDGKQIQDFILDENMQHLYCDSKDRIWAASFSTLFRFDVLTESFQVVELDTTEKYSIIGLHHFPGKGYWVLTTRGFYIQEPGSDEFSFYDDQAIGIQARLQIRPSDVIESIVYFSTADSLVAYNIATRIRRALPLPIHNLRTITGLTSDIAIVSLWKGILYVYDFSENNFTQIDLKGQINNVQDYFMTVFEALPFGKEQFLLASSKGLIEFQLPFGPFRKLNLFHKGKPLEGNLILMDLSAGKGNTLWSAYRNYGLISFTLSKNGIGLVRNYETDIRKAWDNHVRHFAEDENGNLWLATYNGFARWNLLDGTIIPFFAKEGSTTQLNHSSIRGITYDGLNLILGQTNRGVWLYNPKTQAYKRPVYAVGPTGERTKQQLEASFTEQIYTLQNGNHVVSGSNGGYLISKKTYQVSKIDFPGKNDNLNFTYQDKSAAIWIGSERALYKLDTNFTTLARIPKSETSGSLNGICESSDGSIIAAGKGLFNIKQVDTTLVAEVIDSFFQAIMIHTVYRDSLNRLWLATSEGLFRYDMEKKEAISFSHFENIEGNSFYPNSYWRSTSGRLFMGSTRGIIYFDPEKTEQVEDSLSIYITKMWVNDKNATDLMGSPSKKLKHHENTISFEFVAPYYDNANKLKYRYKLNELSESWIENGNNTTVRFHALPPGGYEFVAAVSLNGLDWFQSSAAIEFTILAPFWTTWWFYSVVTLLIVGFFYALYRFQLNKRLEVERLRMHIARDLHDDIGSTLSNIHIISSMAVRRKDLEGNVGQLFSRIKDSSKTMMDNMQDIVWTINPQHDTLGQVLAHMKEFAGEICEAAGMEYQFDMDQHLMQIKLPLQHRRAVYLVFKEAINNAVKYSDATMIHIQLYHEHGGWLKMKVEDNGKGFDHATKNNGNGLDNMKARARQVKGFVEVHSANGHGTRVELKIPIT